MIYKNNFFYGALTLLVANEDVCIRVYDLETYEYVREIPNATIDDLSATVDFVNLYDGQFLQFGGINNVIEFIIGIDW